MRKGLQFLAICIICVGCLSSCNRHNHNTSISVNESGGIYTFTASFPEDKTRKIQRVINKSISPGSLFKSANDRTDITTILQDKTTFYVKSSPGRIRIKINRSGNSPASYNRIKELCEEVKEGLRN
ncbi:MAG: hypothetical protein ABIQ88_06015 [Chitinophagaceae bacterium]